MWVCLGTQQNLFITDVACPNICVRQEESLVRGEAVDYLSFGVTEGVMIAVLCFPSLCRVTR